MIQITLNFLLLEDNFLPYRILCRTVPKMYYVAISANLELAMPSNPKNQDDDGENDHGYLFSLLVDISYFKSHTSILASYELI